MNNVTTRDKLIGKFCDDVSTQFKDSFKRLHVDYDKFVRTTDSKHKQTVEAMWSRIKHKMVLGKHEGWYCPSDEAFVPDNHVDETAKTLKTNPKSIVEWVSEANYKFGYDPKEIKEKFLDSVDIYPKSGSRRKEVETWLKPRAEDGIEWLSVSRPAARVPWAIRVPGDESQSVYVWLDALSGYITATGSVVNPDPNGPPFLVDNFKNVTHVLGKDILKFHCVYWPAFLLAAGIDLPKRIVAHAHWTVNRTKMSKSLNNVVSPDFVIDDVCKGQVDGFRYFLLRDGRLEDDADFSPQLVAERCDVDLADNLGNLLARTCAETMWSGVVAKSAFDYEIGFSPTPERVEARMQVSNKIRLAFSQADFAKGLEALMKHMNEANADFQTRMPWKDAKAVRAAAGADKESMQRLARSLGNSIDALRLAANVLTPVTPTLSKKIFQRIGLEQDTEGGFGSGPVPSGGYKRPPLVASLESTILFNKLGVPGKSVQRT